MKCQNNLKQWGLAMHNFHDSNGKLPSAAQRIPDAGGTPPAAGAGVRVSWVPQVWSYVEQNALSTQYNLNLGWHQSPNCGTNSLNSPVATPLSLYYCPSDRGNAYRTNDTSQRIRGNYVVCWGQHAFQNAANYPGDQGIFGFEDWRSRDKPLRTTLVKITDGTSNTLLMSELIMYPIDGPGNSDFRGDIMNDDAAGAGVHDRGDSLIPGPIWRRIATSRRPMRPPAPRRQLSPTTPAPETKPATEPRTLPAASTPAESTWFWPTGRSAS